MLNLRVAHRLLAALMLAGACTSIPMQAPQAFGQELVTPPTTRVQEGVKAIPAVPIRHLLVIAPQDYRLALQEFMHFKNSSPEISTQFASLDEALNCGGADDAEKLKSFIYIQWRIRKFDYLLLVGDADVMPMRYMVLDRCTPAAFDYAFYASDLYYSDLAKPDGSFADWNGQKEGFHRLYFGEVRGEKNKTDPINFDEIDYQPEIAVGRWPVSSVEEARAMAEKSMAYERALKSGAKLGATTVGLFACGGWVDGRGLLDSLAASLPKNWNAEKRYFVDGNRNDHTSPPNATEAVSLLNSGVGVLAHIGHGFDNGWADSFTLNNLKELKNVDRLPIMISAGCGTGVCTIQAPYEAYTDLEGNEHKGTNNGEVFTAPPPSPSCYQKGEHNKSSMGEQLLRAGPDGAVAYIGCNTGGQPCALTLVEGFISDIAKEQAPRLGDCWLAAVRHYFEKENLATIKPNDSWYPPSVFYQPMKYMVFGDPSLPLAAPPTSAPIIETLGK